MVRKINCRNFRKEILCSKKTVYLMFSADWCAECKGFSDYFEKVSPAFGGEIKFCRLNVDEEPELTEAFGILDVPTVASIKNGKVAGKYSEGIFRERINAFLIKKTSAEAKKNEKSFSQNR